MILADEGRPCEVAQVESLDLCGPGTSVLKAFLTCVHGKGKEIAVRKRSKLRFSYPYDRHRSHTIRIAPKSASTFSGAVRQDVVGACR
jgi:hypothetical protein